MSRADVEPASELGLWDAEFGAKVRATGGEAYELVEVNGGGKHGEVSCG